MSSTETGRKAELAASNYLEMRGFKIIERNWRRPRCEIDIVASKDDALYFVEVKYRKNDDQGGGLDAITSTKLKQMQRSAWYYADETKWFGESRIAAVEVSGRDFQIMSFLDDVF